MPPSAAAGIPFTLEIVSGPTDARPHIVERLPFVVGRLSDADWMVPDPAISGHHFRFEWYGDELTVVDLRSRNRLFVNDREVERVPIADGDIIKAGKTRFRVQFATESAPATTPRPVLPVITAQLFPSTNGGFTVWEKTRWAKARRSIRHLSFRSIRRVMCGRCVFRARPAFRSPIPNGLSTR